VRGTAGCSIIAVVLVRLAVSLGSAAGFDVQTDKGTFFRS